MTQTLGCPFTGCEEQVINTDKDVAIALFNAYISTHTANTGRNQGSGLTKNFSENVSGIVEFLSSPVESVQERCRSH